MYEDHYSGNVCNLVFILNKGRTVKNKNLTIEYDKNQIFFVVGYEMGIWLGLLLNLR